MYPDPSDRYAELNIMGILASIDWSIFSDWYNRKVHWRGFTLIGALDEELWMTLELHIQRFGTDSDEYVLNPQIILTRQEAIRQLRDYLINMGTHLQFGRHGVLTPIREMPDYLEDTFINSDLALRALAKSHLFYLDFLGYLNWIHIAFEDALAASNVPNQIGSKKSKYLFALQAPKTGYLLDLQKDWGEINIPLWIENEIPVRYKWAPPYRLEPRFTRLCPEFLQAHDELEEGVDYPEFLTNATSTFPNAARYDDWLQHIVHPLSNTHHSVYFTRTIPDTRLDNLPNHTGQRSPAGIIL
jgi:hypothetical protein